MMPSATADALMRFARTAPRCGPESLRITDHLTRQIRGLKRVTPTGDYPLPILKVMVLLVTIMALLRSQMREDEIESKQSIIDRMQTNAGILGKHYTMTGTGAF